VNPGLDRLLAAAESAVANGAAAPAAGPLRVGVDLGTANTVVFAVGPDGSPVAGAYEFAQVVRDGLVVDFAGACALLRRLKGRVEERLGVALTSAATAYPPGVPITEVRATRYVLEAAGLECSALVDEPTAANAVLGVRDGAVVDIGGGTTGIAVIADGQVVHTADEPTGGTHFSLVIAGAHKISFEEAEERKCDPAEQPMLLPLVRPVMEKIATIVAGQVAGRHVEALYLVGGTSAFPGIADVIAEHTGIPASVPVHPLFVTPLGVALHDTGDALPQGPPDG
jgi:ethanolamine utilization protein EutJ